MKTYANFDEVRAAVANCSTTHELCQLADDVDALFMADRIAITDAQWMEFTVLLINREDEVQA